MGSASVDRAFRLWGTLGLLVSAAAAAWLVDRAHLDLATEAAIAGAAIATFLIVAWATKILTGRESLTYYHHEIAVLAVGAVVAALVGGRPVLGYLDVTALGVGCFLAFGRIGCLRVGCCHGQPCGRGVSYGADHVAAGFPRYLQGLTLFPVQGLESALVAAIVLVGGIAVLDPHRPGLALTFYVTTYAAIRLVLEELRGDAGRRYWNGLSEAQWTSLALVSLGVAGELTGVLPGHFAALSAGAIMVALGGVAIRRHRRSPAALDPRHVRELAAVVRRAARSPARGPARVVQTSAGVRISVGRTDGVVHYTLSRAGSPLTAAEAERLAQVIGSAVPIAPTELVAGAASTYHALAHV